MSALAYLFVMKLKNQIKSFFYRPSRLILPLFLLACLIVTLLPSAMGEGPAQAQRDIRELYAAVTLIYALVFVSNAKNGFSSGGSMFSMPDVNLIFVSPLKPGGAVLYGMLQQMGRSLYLGFFLLFQYTLVHEYYTISYGALVLIAAGYGMSALFGQLTAIIIYMLCAAKEKRVPLLKGAYYGAIGIAVAGVAVSARVYEGIELPLLVEGVLGMRLLIPGGFVSSAVCGIIGSEALWLLSGIGIGVAVIALCSFLLLRARGDFYEDVLISAQTSFSAITAAKEGKASAEVPLRVKVGKTGFRKGAGGSAIWEKHKIENRRCKTLYINKVSLVIAVMLAFYAYIMKSDITVFITSVYTLMITVSVGRWAKELSLPYVYLIPEKPFVKLIHLLREQLPGLFSDSVVCLLPVHFILSLTPSQTVAMILGRVSFGLVFIGANLLMKRFMSTTSRNTLTVFLYMLLVSLFSLPAVITAALVGMLVPFRVELAYFSMLLPNILAFAAQLFASRNLLEYAEY